MSTMDGRKLAKKAKEKGIVKAMINIEWIKLQELVTKVTNLQLTKLTKITLVTLWSSWINHDQDYIYTKRQR